MYSALASLQHVRSSAAGRTSPFTLHPSSLTPHPSHFPYLSPHHNQTSLIMFTKPLQRLFSSCLAIAAIMIVISCNPDEDETGTPGGSGNTTVPSGETSEWLNPNLNYGSVTDQDGNTYATIEIGTQEWMAENLRTTTYSNGDPIPNVTDASQWSNLTTGAWAHYANDSQCEVPYGKLYNWYTVADPRNVCPTGWHVPTDAEWTVLTDYLGGEDVAGGKMKTTGTIEAATGLWYSPNDLATNSSGFSGAPGGLRQFFGPYGKIGEFGYWWSSTEIVTSSAWYRFLSIYFGVGSPGYDKGGGFSVRCLRD
jgi:uncharacterized protein (TIGR02145 family)